MSVQADLDSAEWSNKFSQIRSTNKMDQIFTDFRQAHQWGSGSLLKSTLLPLPTPARPDRLTSFYESTNKLNVGSDIRAQIFNRYHPAYRLSRNEGEAWIEVYVAYWRAVGEILIVQDAIARGKSHEAPWTKLYGLWKDMTTALIKGYSNGQFQAWTLPCLYVAGKYLRVFAIRADEQTTRTEGNVTFNSGYQDDVVGDVGQNEKLEDAARMINRIFTLCISDR